jgi:hypothetical protein
MEIAGIIIAVIGAFLVFKFITGMIKFVVLAAILLGVFYFMTGGFGV